MGAAQAPAPLRGPREQLKQALAGMSYADQLAAVRPPAAPTSYGGGAEAVQRKIDLSTLESKLGEGDSYSGTIDTDTDCATANSVGDAWVGEGPTRVGYGPPFRYSLLSKDKKRQYRPPMVKQSGQKKGEAQCNYEARKGESGGFGFNAHVTVTDIDAHMPK